MVVGYGLRVIYKTHAHVLKAQAQFDILPSILTEVFIEAARVLEKRTGNGQIAGIEEIKGYVVGVFYKGKAKLPTFLSDVFHESGSMVFFRPRRIANHNHVIFSAGLGPDLSMFF